MTTFCYSLQVRFVFLEIEKISRVAFAWLASVFSLQVGFLLKETPQGFLMFDYPSFFYPIPVYVARIRKALEGLQGLLLLDFLFSPSSRVYLYAPLSSVWSKITHKTPEIPEDSTESKIRLVSF